MAHNQQSGFAALEAILVVVILLIVGGASWFVWHNKVNSPHTAVSSKAVQSSSPKLPTTAATNEGSTYYLRIAEWGVKIVYQQSLQLNYQFVDRSDFPEYPFDYVTLSTPRMTYSGCQSSTLGSYIRFKSGDAYYDLNNVKDVVDPTVKEYASKLASSDYVIAGDYYYFYRPPQTICNDPILGPVQAQGSAEAKAILPRLVAE